MSLEVLEIAMKIITQIPKTGMDGAPILGEREKNSLGRYQLHSP